MNNRHSLIPLESATVEETKMELSVEVLEGLRIGGDAAHIPDKLFYSFLQCTCDSLLHREQKKSPLEDTGLSSIDPAVAKQTHAALATLLLEAAKHDKDLATLSHVLEECKFGAERIKEFIGIYQEYKEQFRILLASIGNNPPHIINADWRLDYYMKDNQLEKVNEPTFLISLKTEECGHSDQSDVQFACSQEQLQDLVGKLKDACKSLERASQM